MIVGTCTITSAFFTPFSSSLCFQFPFLPSSSICFPFIFPGIGSALLDFIFKSRRHAYFHSPDPSAPSATWVSFSLTFFTCHLFLFNIFFSTQSVCFFLLTFFLFYFFFKLFSHFLLMLDFLFCAWFLFLFWFSITIWPLSMSSTRRQDEPREYYSERKLGRIGHAKKMKCERTSQTWTFTERTKTADGSDAALRMPPAVDFKTQYHQRGSVSWS